MTSAEFPIARETSDKITLGKGGDQAKFAR